MLTLNPVRLRLLLSYLMIDDFLVCVIKRQRGMHLGQGQVSNSRGDLLGQQTALLPTDDGSNGNAGSGDMRGAALDSRRPGDQAARFPRASGSSCEKLGADCEARQRWTWPATDAKEEKGQPCSSANDANGAKEGEVASGVQCSVSGAAAFGKKA